jgi:hypothetical protein
MDFIHYQGGTISIIGKELENTAIYEDQQPGLYLPPNGHTLSINNKSNIAKS